MSNEIATDDTCEGWCCSECGGALEYDSEVDEDNCHQWCFCPKHGRVEDEDAMMCEEESSG